MLKNVKRKPADNKEQNVTRKPADNKEQQEQYNKHDSHTNVHHCRVHDPRVSLSFHLMSSLSISNAVQLCSHIADAPQSSSLTTLKTQAS